MTRIFLTMAAVSALGVGAPALSQSGNVNRSTDVRIDNLQTQIQSGVQAGTITRAEAQPLREQLRLLRQAERQYARDGLTSTERRDLQSRIKTLREQIRVAERNGTDRYGASGYIDRDGDGWDDRDYDRDGRLDTYDGQGGPLEEVVCERRGGINGVIDSVLGREDCALRVGQLATANLGGVPYEYRNAYRDGNGVYYRSDGRFIYQIDARTNIILRTFDLD